MSLRAPDIKDEHGWQIVDEEGVVRMYAPSRDKARETAKTQTEYMASMEAEVNGISGEVLPADDSKEAVLARKAWDVHQKLRQATLAMQVVWVAQATYLYEIYDEKLWEALGFESFEAYLADPDTDIEVRMGYHLVSIYKQLVIDRGVNPERLEMLQVSKVIDTLPAIRRKQVSIDEALSDAQVLSRSALKLKLSGRASKNKGKPDTGTSISTEDEPEWGVCDVCGSRARIDPVSGGWLK